jgi:hypothetical protein
MPAVGESGKYLLNQRRQMLFQQAAHVALLHATHLIPTQVIELRNPFDAHLAAELSNAVFELLGKPS